jgi:hypothetical protein
MACFDMQWISSALKRMPLVVLAWLAPVASQRARRGHHQDSSGSMAWVPCLSVPPVLCPSFLRDSYLALAMYRCTS